MIKDHFNDRSGVDEQKRDQERRAGLSKDLQRMLDSIEHRTQADIEARLEQQKASREQDFEEARRKILLEHPTWKYVPEWARSQKSREEIDELANKQVDYNNSLRIRELEDRRQADIADLQKEAERREQLRPLAPDMQHEFQHAADRAPEPSPPQPSQEQPQIGYSGGYGHEHGSEYNLTRDFNIAADPRGPGGGGMDRDR